MSIDPALRNIGKSVGLEGWRIHSFKLERIPKEQHGVFYTGDSYIFLRTVTLHKWDVHFWLGKESTTDEQATAAIKTVEIDQCLGGAPVQYREVQDHESPMFLSYFPNGIRYLAGGYASGYHHVGGRFDDFQPQLLHCKGKHVVRCTQVPCRKESLNLGDVFVLDLGKKLFIWMPPACGRTERIKGMVTARNIAQNERAFKAKVEVLDQDWNENEEFWSHFGGLGAVSTISRPSNDDEDHWVSTNQKISLWRVSDASGKLKISKEAEGELSQRFLDTNDAFILDSLEGGIFVWIGKKCDRNERSQAMLWGQEYIKQQNRPSWTPIVRVIETAEPSMFTQWFADWNSTDSTDGQRKVKSFKPRLFQVSDESGKLKIQEVANFTQQNLLSDDVMLLDARDVIYAWIGKGASQFERAAAEKVAQAFLKKSLLPRSKNTIIEKLEQGKESSAFKGIFPAWDNGKSAEDQSIEDMVAQLLI